MKFKTKIFITGWIILATFWLLLGILEHLQKFIYDIFVALFAGVLTGILSIKLSQYIWRTK